MKLAYYGRETLARLDAFTMRHRVALGAAMAALLCGALAVYNVSYGPLHNLNDIGGWSNRALFIAMTAVVHGMLLMLCTLLSRVNFARTALRQLILTAGYMIMQMAINQKGYAYINVLQPVVRAMDHGGLAAGAAMEHGLSAPALLLTYLITRGPVYDMYLLKLFSIGCCLLMALLFTRAADRNHLGIRAEALLALCVIAPQGFMNAACSALPEIGAVALLCVSLTLIYGTDRPKMLCGALVYGAACALSGACLYALPVYVNLVLQKKMKREHLAFAALLMLAACMPAVICGMQPLQALASLVSANLGLPPYASGAPNLYNILPRAAIEEIPQYAPILRHMPSLDLITYEQEFYTPVHFGQAARGMTLAALAVYAAVCALVYRMKEECMLHRVMTVVLAALIACPNVTSGAWLAADMLCLYALLAAPKLRLPACLVLFATMTSSSYPMTEEVMLPMIYAFALCLLALLMLTGVIPVDRKERANG